MHLQVCGVEEKERNIRARSLASPHRAELGMMWRGEAMDAGARDVCE
jgi:hypothetical protein